MEHDNLDDILSYKKYNMTVKEFQNYTDQITKSSSQKEQIVCKQKCFKHFNFVNIVNEKTL